MKSTYRIFLAVSIGIFLAACSVFENAKKNGINLFTIEQDREFGAQVAAEIDANPAQYPILDSASHKDVYAYLYKVRNNILNSGKVTHKNEFKWRIRVIKDDSTLNAFCTPGGYIYIYTGMLRFLDSEDQFAGVLGHEIGHADMRHSTRQMTKLYGVQALLDILAGDRKLLKDVTASIVGLKFSREHESEADQRSVEYLCPTQYNADAGGAFFQKVEALGGSRQPEFLSTHPNPANRIEHFRKAKTDLGCQGTQNYKSEYQQMLASLNKVPTINFNGRY